MCAVVIHCVRTALQAHEWLVVFDLTFDGQLQFYFECVKFQRLTIELVFVER